MAQPSVSNQLKLDRMPIALGWPIRVWIGWAHPRLTGMHPTNAYMLATGYLEGIHKGKKLTIQEGFSNGFAAGAQCGKRLGRLQGQTSGLLNILLKQMEEGDARVD
ncbi:hypothetical protein PSTT_13517 [Puccinia striiformis]|uniref:Protein YAE1 n=1 Tax=Puccinia striiformis TaxID=27350 RepID=A0A2S4UR82_9BASI|nr:hypothetical protein PSTT_13517 [Puccinia striiformis]